MLCIMGGGKMGSAIVAGLVKTGFSGGITVVETFAPAREALKEQFSQVTVTDTPVKAEGAVIAVKPKDVPIAVTDAVDAGAARIVSIAAGVTLKRLHESAGGRTPVIRAMPNIGALALHSATAICFAPPAHEEDAAWAESVLRPLGSVVRVTEDQMDAVTGLSGSGPAYVFMVAEALMDAGVHAGLPVNVSRDLVLATMKGAADLMTGDSTATDLRSMVTTPGGTTAAGLRVLEQRGLRSAFIEAVLAATERSHEIGKPSTR